MTLSNADRAARAENALRTYVEAKGEAFENSRSEIADLIADLLHLLARDHAAATPPAAEDVIESTLDLARLHFDAEQADPEETDNHATETWSVYESSDPQAPVASVTGRNYETAATAALVELGYFLSQDENADESPPGSSPAPDLHSGQDRMGFQKLIYMPCESTPTVATIGNREAIAYMEFGERTDEYGRLFAKAPEMRERLLNIKRLAESGDDAGYEPHALLALIARQAREALALGDE